MDLNITDCIVGVFYGTESSLSQSYKRIDEEYPVYVGKEFWHRLTGDSDFYYDLIDAFAEDADEMDCSAMIGQIIQRLAHEIDENNA